MQCLNESKRQWRWGGGGCMSPAKKERPWGDRELCS